MAPYVKCVALLPFWIIGLWAFITWPFLPGLAIFLAMFLLGSIVGMRLFKRYATDQQIKDDLRSRLSND